MNEVDKQVHNSTLIIKFEPLVDGEDKTNPTLHTL